MRKHVLGRACPREADPPPDPSTEPPRSPEPRVECFDVRPAAKERTWPSVSWAFRRRVRPGRNASPGHLREGLTVGGHALTGTTQGRQFPPGPGGAPRSAGGRGGRRETLRVSESQRHRTPRDDSRAPRTCVKKCIISTWERLCATKVMANLQRNKHSKAQPSGTPLRAAVALCFLPLALGGEQRPGQWTERTAGFFGICCFFLSSSKEMTF